MWERVFACTTWNSELFNRQLDRLELLAVCDHSHPEVVIRFGDPLRSHLELDGWYEFQEPFGAVSREIANLQLTAHVAL